MSENTTKELSHGLPNAFAKHVLRITGTSQINGKHKPLFNPSEQLTGSLVSFLPTTNVAMKFSFPYSFLKNSACILVAVLLNVLFHLPRDNKLQVEDNKG